MKHLKWTYGVTTVPDRVDGLLPQTLKSLEAAGFDKPRLFIDNCPLALPQVPVYLEKTAHYPAVKVAGNWILSMWELYIRNPEADRYAIFQDDILLCKNVRQYLEAHPYPRKGYLNLCTYPVNHARAEGHVGWYLSNQRGLGAQALVFDRDTIITLLSSAHLAGRMQRGIKKDRSIDGTIRTAMIKVGWHEYVHNPSLVNHVGTESASENLAKQPPIDSFCGEDFDIMTLEPQPLRF